jgi:antirestriction protein ArdC
VNEVLVAHRWLKKLRDDRKLVIRAAAKAQKAADYVLNRNHGDV